jgi:hypothetical protein
MFSRSMELQGSFILSNTALPTFALVLRIIYSTSEASLGTLVLEAKILTKLSSPASKHVVGADNHALYIMLMYTSIATVS